MASVQVCSATPALAKETKMEVNKAEETTTKEVVTPLPPPPPPLPGKKQTDKDAEPEESEAEALAVTIEAKVVLADELVPKKKEDEISPKVVPEPVEEKTEESAESAAEPEPVAGGDQKDEEEENLVETEKQVAPQAEAAEKTEE